MKNLNLNKKWKDISGAKTQSGYKALRISSDCIPDLFIGLDNGDYRCLLLFLPQQIEIKLKKSDKEKLKINYNKSENIILVTLMDNDFVDLFNDLIVSLYSKIEGISKPKQYSKELIIQFYKWAEFFEDRFDSKLSAEEIKGLWGELFVLKELLEGTNPDNINGVLDSWKGPYNKSNDFVLDDKNLEIKTKEESNSFVKISSEFQLEKEHNKGLELIVITLKVDFLNGYALNDLLKMLVELVRQKLGDLAILYKALKQKNLNIDNITDYDNYRFRVLSKTKFDCANERFPKLVKSNIPSETNNLIYNLQTKMITDFIIEKTTY